MREHSQLKECKTVICTQNSQKKIICIEVNASNAKQSITC